MNPIRKQFHADPVFPFDMVYRATKNTENELPDHLHDWHEFVYVHSGRGTFFIDQHFYDMSAGCLFLVPGNIIHRAFPDQENPVTSTALFFNPALFQPVMFGDAFSLLQCYHRCVQERSYRFPVSDYFADALERRLSIIAQEWRAAERGYRHAIALQFQQILLDLSRQTVSPDSLPNAAAPKWMKEALQWIDERLTQQIGLSILANRAAVSPAHFSRVFKTLTGMNVTDYIITRRILLAKKLLKESEDNVSVIATLCGFESIPHFHRMFKKITGTTPSAYRKF